MELTIKQKLKKGIESKDWGLVISAYEGLSGEKIKIESDSSVSDFIFNMRETSQKKNNNKIITNQNDEQNFEDENKKPMREEDVLKGPRFNMWYDEGSIATEDKKFDKLVKPKKLSEKGVRQNTYVDTTCVRCKKNFSVTPDLKKGYICDTCQRNFSREVI